MGWAPRTAVCEAVRAWIVLPRAKVVWERPGSLANRARGTCPAAHRRAVQAFDHPRRLLSGAAEDRDVGFEQNGVGGR